MAGSNHGEELAQKYFPTAACHPIIISSDDVQCWVDRVVAALKRRGIVVLSVHPCKLQVASKIIGKVREALGTYSVKVDREDVPVNYCCREIAETYLILRELRKNPAFRISI